MKRSNMTAATFLLSLLLAGLVSYAGARCLSESFSLTCDQGKLLLWCCTMAFLATCAMCPRRAWPYLLGAAGIFFLLLMWKWTPITQSAGTVAYAITRELAMGYGGVHVLGGAGGDPTWFLAVLAVPLSWITAWVVCREGSTVLVILVCLPVFILCLLIIDLAPVLWLLLLSGALILLALCQNVRERSPAEGSRLAWFLMWPVALLITIIVMLCPPETYERSPWSQKLEALTKQEKPASEVLSQVGDYAASRWDTGMKAVNLSWVGPKTLTGVHVMDYQSSERISYLRGSSLGTYGNNRWTAVDSELYDALGLEQTPLVASFTGSGLLSVETDHRQNQLYTTYYLSGLPQAGTAVDDGYVKNTDQVKSYTIIFDPWLQNAKPVPADYDTFVRQVYLQIPAELEAEYDAFLRENGLYGVDAQQIAGFVKNRAVYDLNTPRVPAGEDFVLYFLRESRQGYCIHFASAAVMLLRAAGIPARYVTGYAVSGPVNQRNPVTEDDAHAWVEYYEAGVGWRPLDPTPAAQRQEALQQPQTALPEQPVPEQEQIPPVSQQEQENKPGNLPQTAEPETERAEASLSLKLLWLLILPGLVLLIWLRRWFGLRYRTERCSKGEPNRRALACWRWLVQLSRADGTKIGEELLCLAEKARFSQHTLTEEELLCLHRAVEQQIQKLKTASAGKRLWHRYGLVLY